MVLHAGAQPVGAPWGPADFVTGVRALLAVTVAVLTALAYLTSTAQPAVVPVVAAIALALDAVDGWLARRTRTVTARGARFDMEVDALLILVLSCYAAREVGPWVLAIGLARYALWGTSRVVPWLRGAVPSRPWRKVVAAVQGIALVYAAADLGPRLARLSVLAVALVLLAISFGTEVWELRRRSVGPLSFRARQAWARAVTAAAVLTVWCALALPNRLADLTVTAFLRIPAEAIVLVAVVLLAPRGAARAVGITGGLLLGVLTVLKLLDMGFFATLDRPFDPVDDWSYFGPAVGVLRDSIGPGWTTVAEVAAVLIVVALLVMMPAAVARLTTVAARHRGGSTRAAGALGTVWLVCAAFHVQFVSGEPLASASTTGLAVDQVRQIRSSIDDRRAFEAQLAAPDAMRSIPRSRLLAALHGKDVVFVFVESYGRVAIDGMPYAAETARALREGTDALSAAGFSARSAFLTSPTFGGLSWLAHATLHSGLEVDSQQRYDRLVATDRFTLSDAFNRAGWRTVVDVPSNTRFWPQARGFYHFDQQYGMHDVGYRGPDFGYATMPDQFTLAAFQRLELASRDRPPIMAEIDLVTSHTPWARIPPLVDWNAIGDGAVYDGLPQLLRQPAQVWQSTASIRSAYAESIRYSMASLVSFIQNAADDNLVVVALGDHQPAAVVSGEDASRDVPVSIIAKDPRVLDWIASWKWPAGLLPAPDAPVLPMSSFRNRFLTAYAAPGPPRTLVGAH